ncbi:hypothetical protein PILCRDRAFT_89994 [Piloderma croceum F 1598]|uniref:Uncharacterized protein n=1 Tax=Piloderma croceum (strain F 1598) TaxID=765440 RepID=A0A0C3F4K5_PILCF|nr:hypothetical protein PILCRDRAFT_89994 [Piloderma croceum F 1598]
MDLEGLTHCLDSSSDDDVLNPHNFTPKIIAKMSKDAWDMSFVNAAAQHVMYEPLEPVGFYTTGHPKPPTYATKNTEKRPCSASTAHIKPKSAKKLKMKNNNKENQPPMCAVKAKKERAAIREASAAAAVDHNEIFALNGQFNKLKKNPGYIFKKAVKELFPGGFSLGSVKSQFERSLKTFNWIMAFESFTGGGGDADLCDENLDDEQIASSEDYKMYGKAPKVTHAVVQNSAVLVSDDESFSDEELATPAKLPASHIVSEPKHTLATQFHASTALSLATIGTYLEQKMAFEREWLEEYKKKRAAEARHESWIW